MALPLLVATWFWVGSFWAKILIVLGVPILVLTAVSTRVYALSAISVEFLTLGVILQLGEAAGLTRLRQEELKADRLEESLHALEEELSHAREYQAGLGERHERYRLLRGIANSFSSILPLEDLLACLGREMGRLIQGADRVLLYGVEPERLALELRSVWQRGQKVTIKAKTGDPFDWWVMRQGQPLLVEEPSKDFRFPQVSPDELGRPLGALLAVPMISGDRPLGVLRVESEKTRGLALEDLRLARIGADLATLGIENSRLYQRTAQLAVTDDLTQLTLRGVFEKRLAQELDRRRESRQPFSILMLDIDHFKVYNDTFGHTAGDKLLMELGRMVGQAAPPDGLAARFGGEEFVLLVPGPFAKACEKAEVLRARVEKTEIEFRRIRTSTTVSIGVAAFPEEGSTPEVLLRKADERLYQAKAQGRNRVCAS